ncbi:hypothetical protein CRG98_002539 [Punica granatum]|uniref:Uncharacterized protein n=1 Tax=Punica granatum TaxID=22663 RepID=A0A2I0LA55_PUNGR|nr:hypothetical protein CRG98_002539 [Punica granatum]
MAAGVVRHATFEASKGCRGVVGYHPHDAQDFYLPMILGRSPTRETSGGKPKPFQISPGEPFFSAPGPWIPRSGDWGPGNATHGLSYTRSMHQSTAQSGKNIFECSSPDRLRIPHRRPKRVGTTRRELGGLNPTRAG